MRPECEALQDRAAVDGAEEILADSAAVEHLAECEDCAAVIAALDKLDQELEELHAIDASDAVVTTTREAVAESPAEPEPTAAPAPLGERGSRRRRYFRLGAIAATIAVAVVTIPSVLNLIQRGRQKRTMSPMSDGRGFSGAVTATHEVDNGLAMDPAHEDEVQWRDQNQRQGLHRPDEGGAYAVIADGKDQAAASSPAVPEGREAELRMNHGVVGGMSGDDVGMAPPAASAPPPPTQRPRRRAVRKAEKKALKQVAPAPGKSSIGQRQDSPTVVALPELKSPAESLATGRVASQEYDQVQMQNDALGVYFQAPRQQGVASGFGNLAEMKRDLSELAEEADEEILSRSDVRLHGSRVGDKEALNRLHALGYVGGGAAAADDAAEPMSAPEPQGDTPAQQLLNERLVTPELAFQKAAGYWANTYVPGDPSIRLLESRLGAAGFSALGPGGRPLELHAGARQYRQPFDPPANSALAVYMHADQTGVAGPETRMLLQVGLQGTSRTSGLRPPMNVGLVLDLQGSVSNEVGASMRALLTALSAARQTGDRFSLTVAGRPGGMLLPPAQFRYGPLLVCLGSLFGDGEAAEGRTLGVPEALELAMSRVAQHDDPASQLGASVVLLVTSRGLGADMARLEPMAHASAVSGIPLSVVGVGGRVSLAEIDALTLAGQGNRRLLVAADEAEALIDRELHSASRVIARAVRLRIRLAPGVKLIEVIGSSRLDERRASRVRAAEEAIDLRVARNLGIEADRGDDEEGIQVVIPGYYAGDSHVVLLDVVATRPGSIADVTVRYKDLVYLRNGVARANLSLGAPRGAPGPLERNVLKNLVAFRIADGVREAGVALARGDRAGAHRILLARARLLDSLRFEVPGWINDPELQADAAMLGDYVGALGAVPEGDGLRWLADSMQYAGHLKVQARRR